MIDHYDYLLDLIQIYNEQISIISSKTASVQNNMNALNEQIAELEINKIFLEDTLRELLELIPKNNSRYISKEVRKEVWVRDAGRCKNCGSISLIEFDHIIPVSKGGSSTAQNIEILCRTCNRTKSNRDPGFH